MMGELYNENLVDSPDDIEQVIEGGEDRAYESGQFYLTYINIYRATQKVFLSPPSPPHTRLWLLFLLLLRRD